MNSAITKLRWAAMGHDTDIANAAIGLEVCSTAGWTVCMAAIDCDSPYRTDLAVQMLAAG